MAAPDSELQIAGMNGAHHRIQTRSAGADHNRDLLHGARRYSRVTSNRIIHPRAIKDASDQTGSIKDP